MKMRVHIAEAAHHAPTAGRPRSRSLTPSRPPSLRSLPPPLASRPPSSRTPSSAEISRHRLALLRPLPAGRLAPREPRPLPCPAFPPESPVWHLCCLRPWHHGISSPPSDPSTLPWHSRRSQLALIRPDAFPTRAVALRPRPRPAARCLARPRTGSSDERLWHRCTLDARNTPHGRCCRSSHLLRTSGSHGGGVTMS